MKLHLPALIAAHFIISPAVVAQNEKEPLTSREKSLLERIAALEQRISALERRVEGQAPQPVVAATFAPSGQTPPAEAVDPWPGGTTVNFHFDGYYAWNANRPVGRVNLLRAFDVTSNSFNINQTGMIVERAANVEAGRRWGDRLDLMYGQATKTLQGGTQNEMRRQVYRSLFQAFGSYVSTAETRPRISTASSRSLDRL